jgi:hypothetical protein
MGTDGEIGRGSTFGHWRGVLAEEQAGVDRGLVALVYWETVMVKMPANAICPCSMRISCDNAGAGYAA